jgi:hypothetical protein
MPRTTERGMHGADDGKPGASPARHRQRQVAWPCLYRRPRQGHDIGAEIRHPASSKRSRFITTEVAFNSPSAAAPRQKHPASPAPPALCLITTLGSSIAAVCSGRRSRRNYQLATHSQAHARTPTALRHGPLMPAAPGLPARKIYDKCANHPVATRNRRLTRRTEPPILKLA